MIQPWNKTLWKSVRFTPQSCDTNLLLIDKANKRYQQIINKQTIIHINQHNIQCKYLFWNLKDRHLLISCLTWNRQTWTSRGKLLNVMGQMKVILVATAYIISKFLFNHSPSNLESTFSVSNSLRFKISASGSQNSLMNETSTGIQASESSSSRFFSIFSWNVFDTWWFLWCPSPRPCMCK